LPFVFVRGARSVPERYYGANANGFKETKASIANKLARATVPASFFLACLAAMQLEGVMLEDI
jgi:hypothetical protein